MMKERMMMIMMVLMMTFAEDDQLLFLLLDYSVCVVLARRDVEDCDVWALEEATKHVHGSGSEVFQDPWFWV